MHMVKATVFRTVQHIGRTVFTVHLCQCPRNGAVKVATGNWSMAQILFVSLYLLKCFHIVLASSNAVVFFFPVSFHFCSYLLVIFWLLFVQG